MSNPHAIALVAAALLAACAPTVRTLPPTADPAPLVVVAPSPLTPAAARTMFIAAVDSLLNQPEFRTTRRMADLPFPGS